LEPGFDLFVILAEMRTGSNLLEETLNQVDDLTCHGEVFNPVHIGGPQRTDILGVTKAERDTDPLPLLARLRAAPGLNGFRYFHDHDPRILPEVLADPRCAKIVLTRNPVESYVSLKIARNTGNWRTSDVRRHNAPKPAFVAEEFAAYLDARQRFHLHVLKTLQVSGQTAFHVDYEDVQSVEIINGLLRFLGAGGDVAGISRKLVPQNPEPLSEKVRNFAAMEKALSAVDWAALARVPSFEPRRGPGAPRAVAATGAPLLYLPLPPLGDDAIRGWLAGLGSGGLTEGFTQKTLKDWMRERPGRRSFTLVRHPLDRAYAVFRQVMTDEDFEGLRIGLQEGWQMPVGPDAATNLDPATERAAFLGFLRFLRANLHGQTPVQQNILWASQSSILQALAQFLTPDLVARAETVIADLGYIAARVGAAAPDDGIAGALRAERKDLMRICDHEVEAAAHAAYGRDYQMFGYGPGLSAL
jgi:hypothetical protein